MNTLNDTNICNVYHTDYLWMNEFSKNQFVICQSVRSMVKEFRRLKRRTKNGKLDYDINDVNTLQQVCGIIYVKKKLVYAHSMNWMIISRIA